MANSIKPEQLAAEIERDLSLYSESVLHAAEDAAADAAKKLVRLTRATAPVGRRGKYKTKISQMEISHGRFSRGRVWYVRAPDYRLTHLLVKGHAKKNGGRTKANPFLQNALAEVLPEYEKKVEEAIKNG